MIIFNIYRSCGPAEQSQQRGFFANTGLLGLYDMVLLRLQAIECSQARRLLLYNNGVTSEVRSTSTYLSSGLAMPRLNWIRVRASREHFLFLLEPSSNPSCILGSAIEVSD
jgi:hypothetical protein